MSIKKILRADFFSFSLFSLAGTSLIIHWSLPLFCLILLIFRPEAFLWMFLAYASIIPHEFGHIFMAKRYGIQTKTVIMTPLGGMALLEYVPTEPEKEFLISAAGPFVSLALSLICLFMYFFIQEELLFSLWFINCILTLSNLIPILPMDGGRLLRSFLGFFMSFEEATNVTFLISTFLCGFMFVFGVILCQKVDYRYGLFVCLISLITSVFVLADKLAFDSKLP